MLLPQHFDEASKVVLRAYQEINDDMLILLSKEMARKLPNESMEQWRIDRLRQAPELYEKMVDRIVAKTSLTRDAILKSLSDVGFMSASLDVEIYKLGGLIDAYSIYTDPAILQVIEAQVLKTQGVLNNLTMTTAVSNQREFINAVTNASLSVEMGSVDSITAIRNAIKDMPSVMSKVLYSSGHSDNADVAIRRAVTTSSGQTAGEVSMKLMDTIGVDLVETSAHIGARPDHARWQGRVFSRSGVKGKYKDFKTETGYGTGQGLCGWNCRHTFYPYIEGVSVRTYTDKKLREYEEMKVKFDGQEMSYYEAQQLQRSLERDLRAEKRMQHSIRSAVEGSKGNKELNEALKSDLRNQHSKLTDAEYRLDQFEEQTGWIRRKDRESPRG